MELTYGIYIEFTHVFIFKYGIYLWNLYIEFTHVIYF